MEISQDLLIALTNKPEILKNRRIAAPSVDTVDYVDEPISYEYFLENYLVPNIPCIFSSFLTSQWKSYSSWTRGGRIQWNLLTEKFGEALVPVIDCSVRSDYAQSRTNIKFSQFVSRVTCRAGTHDDKISCDNTCDSTCDSTCDNTGDNKRDTENAHQLLYLKDWHFARDFSEYNAYSTPSYFTSDWLNEFWEQKSDSHDDYRFLYIGRAGTSTPFHADVIRSYSWSANICGKKKWILYPAGDEELLLDSRGELPSDVSLEEDTLGSDGGGRGPRRIVVIQNAGEVIFVPSGWHHQVFNLEDTISINHNWLNGCNVDICWNYIKKNLDDACDTIADLRETMEGWLEQCQLILGANVGIDFIGFYNLLDTVAGARLSFLLNSQLESRDKEKTSDEDTTSKYYRPVDINHSLFDLQRILVVLYDMLNLETFQDTLKTELSKGLNSDPQDLFDRIVTVLNSNNISVNV